MEEIALATAERNLFAEMTNRGYIFAKEIKYHTRGVLDLFLFAKCIAPRTRGGLDLFPPVTRSSWGLRSAADVDLTNAVSFGSPREDVAPSVSRGCGRSATLSSKCRARAAQTRHRGVRADEAASQRRHDRPCRPRQGEFARQALSLGRHPKSPGEQKLTCVF